MAFKQLVLVFAVALFQANASPFGFSGLKNGFGSNFGAEISKNVGGVVNNVSDGIKGKVESAKGGRLEEARELLEGIQAARDVKVNELKEAAASRLEEALENAAAKREETLENLAALQAAIEAQRSEAQKDFEAKLAELKKNADAKRQEARENLAEFQAAFDAHRNEMKQGVEAKWNEIQKNAADKRQEARENLAKFQSALEAQRNQIQAGIEAKLAELKKNADIKREEARENVAEFRAALEAQRNEMKQGVEAKLEELKKSAAAKKEAGRGKLAEIAAAREARINELKASAAAKKEKLVKEKEEMKKKAELAVEKIKEGKQQAVEGGKVKGESNDAAKETGEQLPNIEEVRSAILAGIIKADKEFEAEIEEAKKLGYPAHATDLATKERKMLLERCTAMVKAAQDIVALKTAEAVCGGYDVSRRAFVKHLGDLPALKADMLPRATYMIKMMEDKRSKLSVGASEEKKFQLNEIFEECKGVALERIDDMGKSDSSSGVGDLRWNYIYELIEPCIKRLDDVVA